MALSWAARGDCTPTERYSKILLFSKIKGGDYSEGYPVPTERLQGPQGLNMF